MAESQPRTNGKFAAKSKPANNGANENGSADGGGLGISANGSTIIDPKSLSDDNGDTNNGAADSGVKKRGRPKGYRKPKTESKETLDLDSLNVTLLFLHGIVAAASKTPELALEPNEADQLATAAKNVMRHYNIAPAQKAIDWFNFLAAGTAIYGSKALAVAARKKDEVAQHRAAQPQL